MLPSTVVRAINVVLRSATLISKFLLTFFVARYLSPSDLGLYGLVAASIGYALFFVGFEFYMYTTRELINLPRIHWGGKLRDQFVFYAFTYFFSLAFILMVFGGGWLPWSYFWLFLALLLLEHFAQELNRLLVVMSDQLFASTVLFIRSGLWCLVAMGYMWLVPHHRNVAVILWAWVAGGLLACSLGLWRISRVGVAWPSVCIDWSWIRRGATVALPFLLATLAMRGLFTFDRYWIKSIAGLEILGVYVFYIGIANAIVSFVDSGVFVFMYPKIITDAKQRKIQSYRYNMKMFIVQILFVYFLVSIVSILSIEYVYRWIADPIYKENIIIFYWLIASIGLFCAGLVPQVGLYAFDKDRPIAVSHVLGFFLFMLIVWVSSGEIGFMSVPYALFVSLLFVLIWKTVAYFRMDKDRFDRHPESGDANGENFSYGR